MRKIRIAGAGPSGLSAAINLAKAGFEVEVFEAARDCGHRFGGDLQALENWSRRENVLEDLKGMNIDVNFDCDPFSKITLATEKELSDVRFNEDLFYLVKRGAVKGSLDQGLKEQAVDSGVKINFNSSVPRDGADIIATGPVSREVMGIDRGVVFETGMDDIAVGLLDNDAAYKGYSYLLVTNGYGCMCTVLLDKFENVNKCFQTTETIFKKHFDFNIRNPKPVGGVGSFSVKGDFKLNGKFFAGEAAGVQDFLWGFGIRNAIASGHLAARSFIENTDYQAVAKSYFENRLKASAVNRFLWEILLGSKFLNNWAINKIGKVKTEKILDMLYKTHNSYSKLIFPVAIRHLGKRYKTLR